VIALSHRFSPLPSYTLITVADVTSRYGECDGDANDLNLHKRGDAVFGSVRVGTDVCQIKPSATNNDTEVTCTPQDDFPKEMDPVDPNINRRLRGGSDVPVRFEPMADHRLTADVGGGHHRSLYDDSGSSLDVMVVWTKAAECKNAYGTTTCTVNSVSENNMRGLIDLAVFETNVAYNFSGIATQLRLVHAYRDANFTEFAQYEQNLYKLKGKGDGYLEDVHAKRTLYRADMVSMIVGTFIRHRYRMMHR
jgi:hypothetical protein